MRVIIQCAGNGDRWGNHLGVPKHLAVLRGEPILHRAVRLIGELSDAEVIIGVADGRDSTYKVDGSARRKVQLDPSRQQADKVLSCEHLWSPSERTVVLFGDIYWTDDAMARVLECDEPWAAFCRFGPSSFTGCDHAELFGFTFTPDERSRIRDAANLCADLGRAGVLSNWSGGWQVYKAAAGALTADTVNPAEVPKARTLGHAVEIDDWTDDLDEPGDWDRWCWHWGTADAAMKAVGHGGVA